ncbi:hypothetical protein [Peptacetobacter sp. AB800]|uniref:hypothetical protein n=1 Tax=Peptacetobacter sp. AB800 TaxID=3388428 RepID=UPI0039FD2E24
MRVESVMDIYKKVKSIIKGLGIECYYSTSESSLEDYVIYKVSTESDSEFADDRNLAVEYNVLVRYLYKKPNKIMRYKDIIRAMKENGFSFAGAYDAGKENPYLIKEMEFIYKDDSRL